MILIALASPVAPASEYIVRPGDTLSRIAERELGSATYWRQIAETNDLQPPYRIRVGQRLELPQPDTLREPTEDSASVPPTEEGATLEVQPPLWGWALMLLAVQWLFVAVCLRIGCWFSLVEAPFERCLLLSFLVSVLFVLFVGLVVGVAFLVLFRGTPFYAVPLTAGILMVAYLVGSVLLIKRILQCKWRSVVTVVVMANVIALLLDVGFSVLLVLVFPVLKQLGGLIDFGRAVLVSS